MKKLMAATTALTLLSATATYADEPQPNMPIEIVTQDAAENALSGDVLVPILMMIFMIMSISGGSSYPMPS